jgi:hypothetical protein
MIRLTSSGETPNIWDNPIPRTMVAKMSTIRSADLVMRFSKRLKRKPSMKPTMRAKATLPKENNKTLLAKLEDSPVIGVIRMGTKRENITRQIKLFNPVSMSSELVTTPSESYSLRTRRVAAGAVAMARIPKQTANDRLVVKKKSAEKTIQKVKVVSHRETVRTVFPIFLKRSF